MTARTISALARSNSERAASGTIDCLFHDAATVAAHSATIPHTGVAWFDADALAKYTLPIARARRAGSRPPLPGGILWVG